VEKVKRSDYFPNALYIMYMYVQLGTSVSVRLRDYFDLYRVEIVTQHFRQMLKCSAVFQRTYSNTDSPVPLVSNLDSPAPKRKSADEIIRSATFPAAHVPPLDDTSPSKSDHWSPCALSLALVALGTVGSL
jgi:hypothetical protein